MFAVRGKLMKILLPVGLFLTAISIALPTPCSKVPGSTAASRQQETTASADGSKVVYVSDFELDVVRRRVVRNAPPGTAANSVSRESSDATPAPARAPSGSSPSSTTGRSSSTAAKPADSEVDQGPIDRANTLVNAMSEDLVNALEKAGFSVRHLRNAEAPPRAGLRIRGVFAEPDEQNRIRRLLVGSDSPAPKLLLYVGVDDLARPEQPLYELAKPPNNDARHGPVITVTSYSPVARFEMSKDPTDEDIKKIAVDVVAGLNALLRANPASASR
jgi:hypothetical protein